MTYVYSCGEHKKEIKHPMEFAENAFVVCDKCFERGEVRRMTRVPQANRHYTNPADVLYDYMDKRFRDTLRKKRV